MPGQTKTRAKPAAKVEHPGKTFADPADVVADPDLSTGEKIRALNTLEQDARQLAVATAEGMDGGEETKLRDILQAKRMLQPPSPEAAFTVVLQTFEAQLQDDQDTDTHALIKQALDAMKAARDAVARHAAPPAAPSAGDLAEELAKEKLDP